MVVRFNPNEFVRRDHAVLFKGEAGQAAGQARDKLGAMAAQLVGSDGRVKSGYLSLHSHKDGSLSVGTRAGIFGFSDGTFQASTLIKTLVRQAYGDQPHVEQALNKYMARSDVRSGTHSFVQMLRTLESGRASNASAPGMERVGLAKVRAGTRLGQLLDRQDQPVRQWLVKAQSAVVDFFSASSRLSAADLAERRQALRQLLPDAQALQSASPALRSEAERMVAQIKALATPPRAAAASPKTHAAPAPVPVSAPKQAQTQPLPSGQAAQQAHPSSAPDLEDAALDLPDAPDFPDALDLPDEDDAVPAAPARALSQASAPASAPAAAPANSQVLSPGTRLDASNLQTFLNSGDVQAMLSWTELRAHVDVLLDAQGLTLETFLQGQTTEQAKTWIGERYTEMLGNTQWAQVDGAKASFQTRELLKAVGLRLRDVPGDGHCAFHAMAYAEGGARRKAFLAQPLEAAVAHRLALIDRLNALKPKQLEFLGWNAATVAKVAERLAAGLEARPVSGQAWGTGTELALQSIETGRPLIALTPGRAELFLPTGVKFDYPDPSPQSLAELIKQYSRSGVPPAVLVNETDTHWMATEPLV